MATWSRRLRAALFASVSVLALTVGAAQVRAGDLPNRTDVPVLKAPSPVQLFGMTAWMEGGAFWTGGDPVRLGIPGGVANPAGLGGGGFGVFRPNAGWEGAAGVDWRATGTPWHVSFDVRYGQTKASDQSFMHSFSTVPIGTLRVDQQGRAKESESHLVADLMVGRDIGIGGGPDSAQLKFGLRIADLESRLHADLQAMAHCATGGFSCGLGGSSSATAAISLDERSQFLGIGPRAAIEGAIPLSGPWGIDYEGGAAALFGQQKLTTTGDAVVSNSFFGPTGIFGFNNTSTSNNVVFNADALAALSYSFTQRVKVSAGFRFDGYWKALKTFDTNGNIVDTNRFYYGPFLRLTGKF